MDSIGDDLLREILIRLPDSWQALRCVTVCKRWSSLISATQFARSFTARRQSLNGADFSDVIVPLLFERPDSAYYREEVPIVAEKHCHVIGESQATRAGGYLSFLPWDDVIVRAYYDDLLLVSRLSGGRLSFCVCNPMTKKYWCDIPKAPLFPGRFKCTFTIRLGKKGHRNYHVTLFLDNYCPANEVWAIDFSSEIGEWSSRPTMVRLPTVSCFVFSTLLFSEPVACGDGLVYWADGRYCDWECVVAFDPSASASSDGRRDSRLIPRPSEAGDCAVMTGVRLGAYRGRLRAAFITESLVLRVWELNHASSCWSLVHDSLLGLRANEPYYPLALHAGDRNLIFLATDNGYILRYDMSSRTGQRVGNFTRRLCPVFLYPLCSTWPTPVLPLQPN